VQPVRTYSGDSIDIVRETDGNVNVTVIVDYDGLVKDQLGINSSDWAMLQGA
jgi:hypothetical protein